MSALVVGMAAVTAAALAYATRCRHRANHDQLTGLLNRAGLASRWRHVSRQPVAVLLLDLDRFKPVNDRYGHAAGDEVLAAVALRLRCVPGATVARLGGDEFAIVTRAVWRLTIARQAATAVAVPIRLSTGPVVRVAASIGVSTRPPSLRVGLHQADQAMYQAKASGYGMALFMPGPDDVPVEDRPTVRTRDLRHQLPTAATCPVCGSPLVPGGTCTNPRCLNRHHRNDLEGMTAL